MKNWKIGVILIVGLLIGCSSPDNTPTEFTRKAMLENVVNNVILPLNADFVAQTAVLETGRIHLQQRTHRHPSANRARRMAHDGQPVATSQTVRIRQDDGLAQPNRQAPCRQ